MIDEEQGKNYLQEYLAGLYNLKSIVSKIKYSELFLNNLEIIYKNIIYKNIYNNIIDNISFSYNISNYCLINKKIILVENLFVVALENPSVDCIINNSYHFIPIDKIYNIEKNNKGIKLITKNIDIDKYKNFINSAPYNVIIKYDKKIKNITLLNFNIFYLRTKKLVFIYIL